MPVKAEFSGEFPGIVHDTSASGQTLFIEPLAALETNNRLRTLRLEEEREVARILAEFSRRVGRRRRRDRTQRRRFCAALDLLAAKPRLRSAMNAVAPELAKTRRSSSSTAAIRCSASARSRNRSRSTTTYAAARHQRAEHGRQDRRAQDGRAVRRDDVLRHARAGRPRDRRSAASRASSPTSATNSRSRQHIDVLGAPGPHARDARPCRRTHAGAHRRDRRRHRTQRRRGARHRDARAAARSRRARGLVTTHATELKLFAHARPASRTRACASTRTPSRRRSPRCRRAGTVAGVSARAGDWHSTGSVIERAAALARHARTRLRGALAELSLRNAELQSERDALRRRAPAASAARRGALQRARDARRRAARVRRARRGAHAARCATSFGRTAAARGRAPARARRR